MFLMHVMTLTQKNRLRLRESDLKLLQQISYHNAKLYNVGLYSVRQHFFQTGEFLTYSKNYHLCKSNENYSLLLTDNAQQTLKLVERDMHSFFGSLRAKQKNSQSHVVKLPRYKKNTSPILIQGRSARIRDGYVLVGFSNAFKATYAPIKKELRFKLPKNVEVTQLQELRILPLFGGQEFEIEFVYHKQLTPPSLDSTRHLSLDLGLDNILTSFNSSDGSSFVVDGKYIKSINHRYNKERARLQSLKDQQGYRFETRRMFRLSQKRKHRLNDYFNRVAKWVVDYCVKHNLGTLVLGSFSEIKQNIQLGRVNNQNFVQIPYQMLIRKLRSQCEQKGVTFFEQEESYTSKCSFLDVELVCRHDQYQGRRIHRGLFKTKSGILVNADKNGAANILRKFLTSNQRLNELCFERLAKGFVNNPVRVKSLQSSSL